MENKKYICPVCGYDKLDEKPYNIAGEPSFEICPCCGFEYGYDDMNSGFTFESYKDKWVCNGAKWVDKKQQPKEWSLEKQLKNLEGLDTNYTKVKFDINGKIKAPLNYKDWIIRVEGDNEDGFYVYLANLLTKEQFDEYYENFAMLDLNWDYEVDWDI